MADNGGPWRAPQDDDRPPPVPRHRFVLWIALMAALGCGVFLLSRLFPGQSGDDWAWIARGAALMAVVSTGVLTAGRIRWGEKARHAAIWLGLGAVLVLGVTYRDELAGVGRRVGMEFSSSYPVETGPGEVIVVQSEDGGFHVMGVVNDQPVRFLVDTGASETVLSPADAERIGVDLTTVRFDQLSETANGTGYGARVTVDRLAVGPIVLRDVPVIINKAPMSSSLLGLTFLQRLESFQVSGRKLHMKRGG